MNWLINTSLINTLTNGQRKWGEERALFTVIWELLAGFSCPWYYVLHYYQTVRDISAWLAGGEILLFNRFLILISEKKILWLVQQELMYLRTTWQSAKRSSQSSMWKAVPTPVNVRNMYLCSASVAPSPACRFLFTSGAKLCFRLSVKGPLMKYDGALQCRGSVGVLHHRECVDLYFFKTNPVKLWDVPACTYAWHIWKKKKLLYQGWNWTSWWFKKGTCQCCLISPFKGNKPRSCTFGEGKQLCKMDGYVVCMQCEMWYVVCLPTFCSTRGASVSKKDLKAFKYGGSTWKVDLQVFQISKLFLLFPFFLSSFCKFLIKSYCQAHKFIRYSCNASILIFSFYSVMII